MKTKTYTLIAILSIFLACFPSHAGEQDNWYFHKDWDGLSSSNYGPGQVAFEENASDGKNRIYVADMGNNKVQVYDLNGSKIFEITNLNRPMGVTIDKNGTIYCLYHHGIKSFDNNGTLISTIAGSGSGDGQIKASPYSRVYYGDAQSALAIHPENGKLYALDGGNNRVQVFDTNGSFSFKFGIYGTAPGQFKDPKDIAFMPDNTLAITDDNYLHFYDDNGNFLDRKSHQHKVLAVSNDGSLYIFHYSSAGRLINSDNQTISYSSNMPRGNRGVFTPQGDLIFSKPSGKIEIWKRAFRTKGLENRNFIPQPSIRGISQRSGSNIIDLDFEIIDSDDNNATVGIIAHCGSDKVVPKAWVDGTGSKIASPIGTNVVHRVSWDVKQDWTTSTGTIKFEILCQDGSRNKPVDLHFLTLPLDDGNLTISRSPLKDSDYLNYAKYLLSTGQAQFESNESQTLIIPAVESNATEVFTFTNAGATGRNGPTEAQLIAEYNGTNLQGLVTPGWKAGFQKWTVPASGSYWIEAVGARGGNSANEQGGCGAFIRGKFTLVQGQELNIVVGQHGGDNSIDDRAGSGGGGTFVIADTNNTPLVVAGGGGGVANNSSFSMNASTTTSAQFGGSNNPYPGGTDGNGALGERGGGGGGFFSSGSGNANQGGESFQLGARGGLTSGTYQIGFDGGFGGGGATQHNTNEHSGAGGGYSGGGGSKRGTNNFSGGGGSFNGGANQTNLFGFGGSHGLVRIYRSEGIEPTFPECTILNSNWNPMGVTAILILDLGQNYRAATSEEVTKAREAATPGSVNNWTASRKIQPRNLPGSVNEYGFDVSTTSGAWIIKE